MVTTKTLENEVILVPALETPSPEWKTREDNWVWEGRAFNWQRHPKLPPARDALVKWAWNFSGMDTGYALILAGDAGCGKTHLASVIYQAYEEIGARFFDEPGLFDKLYGNKQKVIAQAKNAFPLILDDVGKEHTKPEWLQEIYWQMLNNNSYPLLITTNLKSILEVCDWMGEFAASRLMGKLGSNSKERRSHFIDLFGVPDARTAD